MAKAKKTTPYKFVAISNRGYVMAQSDIEAVLIKRVKAEIARKHCYDSSAAVYKQTKNITIGDIPIEVTEVR